MTDEEQETGFSTAQIKAITDIVRGVLSEAQDASQSATASEAGPGIASSDGAIPSSGSQQGEGIVQKALGERIVQET